MIVAGVWTGVGFSKLKNSRTRIQKFWNRSGVGVWKSDSGYLWWSRQVRNRSHASMRISFICLTRGYCLWIIMRIVFTILWVTLILNTVQNSVAKYMYTTFECKQFTNIHSGWAECLSFHFVPALCTWVKVHFSVKLWFLSVHSNHNCPQWETLNFRVLF